MNSFIFIPLIITSVFLIYTPFSIATPIKQDTTFKASNKGSEILDQIFPDLLELPKINEMVLTSKNDIPKHIWIASQYLKAGEFDTVITICKQILTMENNNIDALAHTAAAYKGLGEESLFKKHVKLINELAPHSATLYLTLANTYSVLRDFKNAEKSYKEGLKFTSDSTELRIALATLYLELGRINEAYDQYLQTLKKKRLPAKHFLSANFAICKIDLQAQKFNRVIKRAKMITDLYPPIPQGYIFWASAHLAKGEPDLSIKVYEKLIKVNPESPVSYQELALIYNDKLNDNHNALRYAKQGVRKFPGNAKSQDILGWINYQKKSYPEALKFFQLAVSLTGNHPQYLYHLGLTHQQMGDVTKANNAFQKALNLIDPIKSKAFADELTNQLKQHK